MTTINIIYKCKYHKNDKFPGCFPAVLLLEKCPLLLYKMINGNEPWDSRTPVCTSKGIVIIDWVKQIRFNNIINEYFIKL